MTTVAGADTAVDAAVSLLCSATDVGEVSVPLNTTGIIELAMRR